MTQEQMAQAISNLTDRMNRVEANVAHIKSTPTVDPLEAAIDAAIAALNSAAQEHQRNRTKFLRWLARMNRDDK